MPTYLASSADPFNNRRGREEKIAGRVAPGGPLT
jgi:hypothetical protein